MNESVKQCGSHLGIAEHAGPFREAQIGISYLELSLVLTCAGAFQQGEETHGHRLPSL